MAKPVKARVYGGDLSALCESQDVLIPTFVSQLMEYIEEVGIDEQGVYRMSGNKKQIAKLRSAIEGASGNEVNLEGVDVHCVTTCLMSYFMELYQPLIPFSMYHSFIEAARSPNKSELFSFLVKELPQANFYTLCHLFQHLYRIAANSEINKMPTKNIGIVFANVIFRAKSKSEESGNMRLQSGAIETMIAENEDIFQKLETIFGCNLDDVYSLQDGVPSFLVHLMHHIESVGLRKPGLYKGTGMNNKKDTLNINMLRLKMEMGDYDLSKCYWATPYVVAWFIKKFFTDLSEPLVPYSMHSYLVKAAKSLHTERVEKIKSLVKKLPEINYKTLKAVIGHLKIVSSMSIFNEMTQADLALGFGVAFMHPSEELPVEIIMQNTPFLNRAIELMMANYETVFDVPKTKKKKSAKPTKPKEKTKTIKYPAFGVNLADICERDEVDVPNFFTHLVNYIDRKGLNTVGLYQQSTNPAGVNLLKDFVQKGDNIDIGTLEWLDPHIAANTIKMFFEELSEPLIPNSIHGAFIEISKMKSLREKVEQYKILLTEMPDSHYFVLRCFLRHLKNIVQNKKANKSSTTSMGILFGGILMHKPEDSSKKVLSFQNSVVEDLVRYFDTVFSRKFPVFGSDLSLVCKHEKKTVPTFFTQILEKIENFGMLEEVSIYRPVASQEKIRKFMDLINEGEELDYQDPLLQRSEVLTAIVKIFLDVLPDPLIPVDASRALVDAAYNQFVYARAEEMAFILRDIPECNYCTLKALLDHLLKVIALKDVNRMPLKNIVMIFTFILTQPNFQVEENTIEDYFHAMHNLIELWPQVSEICNLYRYAPVFGYELAKLCARQERSVPTIVEECIQFIESEGMDNRFIYAPPSDDLLVSSIIALKKRFSQGLAIDHDQSWITDQVVANCLKDYFNELPESLIPSRLYQSFISAIRHYHEHYDRVEKLSLRVKELELPHHDTLKLLVGHFRRLAEVSHDSLAALDNLATIFSPIIMGINPADLDVGLVTAQKDVLKLLITEYDNIFPGNH